MSTQRPTEEQFLVPPPRAESSGPCPAFTADSLRLVLDLAGDRALIPLDANGAILAWDAVAERLTHHLAKAMVGQSAAVLFSAEDQLAELPRRLLDTAQHDGHAMTKHLRVDADNKMCFAETVVVPSRHAPAAFVLVTRNLHDDARANEVRQLQSTVGQFEMIAQSMPDVIALFDRDARCLFVNRAIQKMTGQPPSHFVGKTPRQAMASSGYRTEAHAYVRLADNWEAAVRDAIASNDTGPHELHFNYPVAGDVHAFVTRMMPQMNAKGRVDQVVTITQDMSARHRVETELRQAKEAAEAACSAKDQFLAMLSHELRTPLTPVLVAAQEMEDDERLPTELRESAAMIHRNVELESRLIDDLLDLTRIAHGKLDLQLKEADIHDVIRRAVEMVSAASADARPRSPQIVLELDATRAEVWGDAARLQQVLWNLIKNAVKFTPADGRVVVRTANVGADNKLQVDVVDSGVGIPPDVLPVIFNAFEQGGAVVTRRFGGLGLGLSISRSLADLHLGSLSATSAGAGHGATFTLTLPTIEARPAPQGPPAPIAARLVEAAMPAAADPTHDRPLPKILLVEDHADTARYMARMLKHKHFDVRVANDVASAVRAAKAETFDLVVSDLGLPDGTGYDLMRQLRGMGLTRGIALSGYGMQDDLAKSHQAGFCEHLVKPVSYDVLLTAIAHACDATA